MARCCRSPAGGHRRCTPRPVTSRSFDDRLHELVKDMFATMEAAQGVGLAANQVGRRPRRVRLRLPRRRPPTTCRGDLQPGRHAAGGQGPQPRQGRRGLLVPPRRLRGAGATGLRRLPGRGRVRRRVEVPAPDSSPAACSTRPITSTGRSSVTGWPAGPARSCTRSTRSWPSSTRRTGPSRRSCPSDEDEDEPAATEHWKDRCEAARSATEDVAGDRGGGRDVERVDAGLHRDDGAARRHRRSSAATVRHPRCPAGWRPWSRGSRSEPRIPRSRVQSCGHRGEVDGVLRPGSGPPW